MVLGPVNFEGFVESTILWRIVRILLRSSWFALGNWLIRLRWRGLLVKAIARVIVVVAICTIGAVRIRLTPMVEPLIGVVVTCCLAAHICCFGDQRRAKKMKTAERERVKQEQKAGSRQLFKKMYFPIRSMTTCTD